MVRIALLLILATPSFGQFLSFGVKGGVPLTDTVRVAGEIADHPFQAEIQRFTVGPIVGAYLPFGLGIEFGAMYKRFDQQVGTFSKTGQSWEFPLVGQYVFPGVLLRPYVEVGIAFNHLSDVFAPIRTGNLESLLEPEQRSEDRRGLVLGAGLQLKVPGIRVTPGLRYTRYGKTEPWLPSADAVDFLIGITF